MGTFTKSLLFLLWFVVITLYLEEKRMFARSINVEEDVALTNEEAKALEEFKSLVVQNLPHEYMKQDIYLIKWLRAKKLNLKQAENMLMDNLRWRENNNMDTILDEDWSDMEKEYEYTSDTEDLQGRPIGTIDLGLWNHRKAIITGKGPKLLRYLDKLLEELSQKVVKKQALGQNVTQWKVLYDMAGFNLLRNGCPLCLPLYPAFVTSFEQHYPGMADQIIIINSPRTFEVVLFLVQPIFTAETRQALRIFSGGRKQWMDYLDLEISPEQRRPEYGGIKQD